ncbi:YjbH domain-containing protein [Anianabacter salinae]|uniref:YjbH domain-containing protein n=1 Tax=Anianabacter salinae TaxID=2851023 RepID=UPI00225E0A35|nr:YjbH domain-containing protein [Anianabacter salinae]MBV0913460.1 YjbH domain-containing protein [Anianabacter salinae]
MRLVIAGLVCVTCSALAAAANEALSRPTYNTYGLPGLIDMPSAESAPDAELAVSDSYFAGTNRTTLSFQILPRLTGSFRYSQIANYLAPGSPLFDRSFDLRFRFLDEGRYRPAMAVGLRDFIGTGAYASEYIVATKHIGDRVKVTAGLGWGRLSSNGGFSNPLSVFGSGFDTRPVRGVGLGGTVVANTWFRGPAAAFGGIEWQATDRLSFKAEYSSDAYTKERSDGLFAYNSPFNFGVSYDVTDKLNVGANYLYGNTVGIQATFTFNPKHPSKYTGSVGPAPAPVMVRPSGSAADLGWTQQVDAAEILERNLSLTLASDGMELEGFSVDARTVRVRVRNDRFLHEAQFIGRVARVLTNLMPASVESFVIVPVTGNGTPTSVVAIARSDMEELEFAPDGSWQSYARAEVSDAYGVAGSIPRVGSAFPKFTYGFGPYVAASLFDPTSPVRADLGIQASARYEPRPGLVMSGQVRKRLVGNRSGLIPSNSVIQRVRSDANIYAAQGDPAITHLTIAQYFRPGPDLYGRVTAGYLEPMYGGVSAELLWKPVDSRWAFGAEVNYAQQRDFDQLFGFQNYCVVTGHASAYYDMGNGFHFQVNAGRYLAGDWGATLIVDREFDNGISIGAFATLTDVPFSQFGEGSFDKGLRITIPLAVLTGRPSRTEISRDIRPVLRDGGARLEVDGRLYDSVRDYHEPELEDGWGRFWR